MNKWIGIGRLVAEPEARQTQSGDVIAKYRLAVDRPSKKDGQQTADFISCVAFGRNGEFAEKYLHKGTKIAIEGRIQTGKYTKDDGSTVYTTDIVVERHEFCESRVSADIAGQAAPIHAADQTDQFEAVDTGDDLPF